MDAEKFIKTLYLGDRTCKRILIDSWNERCGIQINRISRLKDKTSTWDFYTDDDLDDGWIVFDGVTSFAATPPGPIPNESIEIVEVTVLGGDGVMRFKISVGSVNQSGKISAVMIEIVASQISVETNEQFLSRLRGRPQ